MCCPPRRQPQFPGPPRRSHLDPHASLIFSPQTIPRPTHKLQKERNMTTDLKQDKNMANRTTTIGDGNSITRCKLSNCAVTSSWLKRCDFTDCALVHVRSARRTQASKCHLHDVFSVKRSEMTDSAITGRSSIQRSSIRSSTIQNATRVSRSTVARSVVQKGDLWRASVTDCFVEECVIYRSDFKNAVLKYGVWKRGKLVGRTGDRAPVFISKDGVATVRSRVD